VFIEQYPEVRKVWDINALKLRSFSPGAYVRSNSGFQLVSDPLRAPSDLLEVLFSPVGSFVDKIRLGLLSLSLKVLFLHVFGLLYRNLKYVMHLQDESIDAIFKKPESDTESYLRNTLSFSDDIIDKFFRPFYMGIFLAPLALQSSNMFEFIFKVYDSLFPPEHPFVAPSCLQCTRLEPLSM
jgi:hypothetical protein